jgi:hypothetical protein
MAGTHDGPQTTQFDVVKFKGNGDFGAVPRGVSRALRANVKAAPTGSCVAWGLPFHVGKPVIIKDEPVTVKIAPTRAEWLVFMHTSDLRKQETNEDGFISPQRGSGMLGEHAADYVLIYANGAEERVAIRRRHQIGAIQRGWGENGFECVPDHKPHALPGETDDQYPLNGWGRAQQRCTTNDMRPWLNWLWAWQNPRPRAAIVAVRFEPVSGVIVVSGLSAGKASAHPLRWESRRKAVLAMPNGRKFDTHFNERGKLKQLGLDMGQIISVGSRPLYPNSEWSRTHNNQVPDISKNEILVEYTAHPDACFHLPGKKTVPAAKLGTNARTAPLRAVGAADQAVTVRVVEKGTGKLIDAKLHIHGEAGEYLPPDVHHRIPNLNWFQDYGAHYSHYGRHHCVYIPGETRVRLPLGKVYIEVSKGFEVRPVRKVVRVTKATEEITVELEKVLDWREKNWVTADTHVHFLSPTTALLEGAAEGVNVVNLLASQWGELMTNVGDFDGRKTHGEAENDGEYLVRVGTENRQHVMGHISLLGYEGRIISPMCTGGTDEGALGDPIEILLTEWARRCKAQNGVVVIPHFPNPRCENAAVIVDGQADAVEMGAWTQYGGISPYALSDWYRYLNCGYFVAAVGGTDKMSASVAVGTMRTYAQVDADEEFNYEQWMAAVRRGHTFATVGPLMEFAVDGQPPGSRISMTGTGGTVDVTWELGSVQAPMTRVDLIVNGEIRRSRSVKKWGDKGSWSIKLDGSSWVALLVRAQYPDQDEIVAAHSSPVMVELDGSPFMAAADALTILEQIEGAVAYLDTVGTRAEVERYKQMRLALTGIHRKIHNRMHKAGVYHGHTPVQDHPEHHHG